MGKEINTSSVTSQVDSTAAIKDSNEFTEALNTYNRAVKDAAQQAATQQADSSVIAPPTGDPSKVSAPVSENITFEDRLRARLEKEYEEERRKEQKRLDRQRLGYGISGLAATIGDMVRASEGAPVNPRDWQRIYDGLTEQERANMNNYQVRMAKLREDARADRKAAAAAAAQAEATKQQRDYEVVKDYVERNFKGNEAEKNRILKLLLGTASINVMKNKNKGKTVKYIPTMLGNTTFQVPTGEAFGNYVRSVVNVLNTPSSYLDGKEHAASLLDDQTLSNDPDSYYKRNVVGILSNYWDDITPSAQKKIENFIYGHGGVKGLVAPDSGDGWSGDDEEYDD